MKAFFSIISLIISNTFMTYAWYGHLKFKEMKGFKNESIKTNQIMGFALLIFAVYFIFKK